MRLFEKDHWFCCDENMAMCGQLFKPGDEITDRKPNCRLCNILFEFPCKPGCYGPTAGLFNAYVQRGTKSSSVLSVLKETTARIRNALASIVLRLKGFL